MFPPSKVLKAEADISALSAFIVEFYTLKYYVSLLNESTNSVFTVYLENLAGIIFAEMASN